MKLEDPSELPAGPRRFVAYFLQSTIYRFQKRGFYTLLPLRVAGCAALGWYVGSHTNSATLGEADVILVVYAAALTFNAILLAICWAAFAKIFDVMSENDFGTYLHRTKMDGHYGIYVEYIHLVQMIALAAVAGSIVLFVVPAPAWLSRWALGVSVGFSLYAAIWASGSVRIMRDLSDLRTTFAELQKKENVTDLRRGQS